MSRFSMAAGVLVGALGLAVTGCNEKKEDPKPSTSRPPAVAANAAILSVPGMH